MQREFLQLSATHKFPSSRPDCIGISCRSDCGIVSWHPLDGVEHCRMLGRSLQGLSPTTDVLCHVTSDSL